MEDNYFGDISRGNYSGPPDPPYPACPYIRQRHEYMYYVTYFGGLVVNLVSLEGLIGNILAMVGLLRSFEIRSSTFNRLLTVLIFYDCLVLLGLLVVANGQIFYAPWLYEYDILFDCFQLFSTVGSVYITVAIGMERLRVFCLGNSQPGLLKMCFPVILMSITLPLSRSFEESHNLHAYISYRVLLELGFIIVLSAIPITLLGYIFACIVKSRKTGLELYVNGIAMASVNSDLDETEGFHKNQESSASANQKGQEEHCTWLYKRFLIVFFVCYIPWGILMLASAVVKGFDHFCTVDDNYDFFVVSDKVRDVLAAVKSSSNFTLLFAFSPKFKNEITKLFIFKKVHAGQVLDTN